MASVFAQLLDTYPMHLAMQHVRAQSRAADLSDLGAHDVRPWVHFLGPNREVDVRPRTFRTPAPGTTTQSPAWQRLWQFSFHPDTPHLVSDVDCLSRAFDRQPFRVFESVEWGSVGQQGFKHEVTAVTSTGKTVMLPLSTEYLHSRFLVTDGAASKGGHWRWPLEARLDLGLVTAFAYELGLDNIVRPYRSKRDPVSHRAVNDGLGVAGFFYDLANDTPEGWLAKAMEGDFMPLDSRTDTVYRRVGQEAIMDAALPRFLVVASLALNRERADFDPGGVGGMARIFPQFMIRANVPVKEMRAALRWKRPKNSWDRRLPHNHHHGHASTGKIAPLMCTDANRNNVSLSHVGPLWSDIFAYCDDSWSSIGRTRMHVVKTNVKQRRVLKAYGSRWPIVGIQQTEMLKLPRQGEFDSIHLAPSLNLDADGCIHMGRDSTSSLRREWPINPSAWRFDDVSMAPVCEHDCLHTHWRWGEGLSGSSTQCYGFSRDTPQVARGAPMIPENQDLFVTLPAENEVLYEVEIGPEELGLIPANRWQVVNHHGSGFLTGIASELVFATTKAAVGYVAEKWENCIPTKGNDFVTPLSSHAALYWHMRYKVDMPHWPWGVPSMSDRISLSPTQYWTARRF